MQFNLKGITMIANVWRAFFAVIVACLFSFATMAQTDTGQLIVKVVDPNGAVVSGAIVTAKSVDNGREITAAATDAGIYALQNLRPGFYDVTVSQTGFAANTKRVEVTVGSRVTYDAQLSVNAISGTTVDIVASGGVEVNTQTQEVSTTVSGSQLRELPSLTRNPYDFVALSGGVSGDPGGSTGRGVGVAINGQRAASTNILLNGGDNVNTFTATVGQSVPLDSVQEYKIITNSFLPEYGRATGGVVNVVTKSGTNEFHGTAFEFNRISKLASASFDDNANGLPKRRFTRNQFGYSIGGPIERDKLFFFSSTEFTRIRSFANVINLVPTSQLLAASNANTQSFFNAYQLRTPINGSIFTAAQIAAAAGVPVSATSANAFGKLAFATPNLPAFGQVRYSVPSDVGAGIPQNAYSTNNRIDYNYSDKTQLSFIFSIQKDDQFAGSLNSSPYTGFDTGQTDLNQNYNVTLTHTFTPNLVYQGKVIFNRLNNLQPLGSAAVGPTLYLTGTAFQRLNNFLVAFPGYSAFTPGNAIPFGGPQNLGQIYQDVNYTRGLHAIHVGGQFEYIRDNRAFGAYQNAVEQLGSNPAAGLNNFVNGQLRLFQAAVFPQGKFPGQTLTLPVGPPDFTRSNRYRDFAIYGNDTYRIRPHVTLNLGLRYEYYGVQHNKNQSKDSNFYFGSGSTIFDQVRNGSVQIAPQSPIGGLYKPDRNNFAPRVGIAWDVFGDGKTSLRAGFGISYERNFGNVTYNVIQNPPNYAVVSLLAGSDVATIPVTLNNAGPLGGTSGTKVLPASSLRFVRNDIVAPYTYQYSTSFERQISPGTLFSVEYSGSKSLKLYSIENLNRSGTGLYYLGSRATTPTGGTSTRLNGQYSNINTRGNNGFSLYNGVTFSMQSNNFMKTGLDFTARYTYSVAKDNLSSTFSESNNNFNLGLTDPFNPRLDYGYADFDVRHRFVSSINWQIPFANNFTGAAKHLLGGWTIAGILQARTGTPFSVFDCSNAITTCIRAEMASGQQFTGSKNPANSGLPNSFNFIQLANTQVSTFTDVSGGTEVAFPANMTKRNAFRAPGFYNIDGAVYKSVNITERYKLQLRAEFYNLLNHANQFVNYSDADLSNATTDANGKITSPFFVTTKRDGRRNVQLALKFIF